MTRYDGVGELQPEDASGYSRALDTRSRDAVTLLEATVGLGARSDVLRLVAAAVASQHPDGAWGSDDDPRLKACFTAQTIDALLRIGPPFRWSVDAASGPYPAKQVALAIDWLLDEQDESGRWGEDWWDTSEVARSLLAAGVPANNPKIQLTLDALRTEIDLDWPDRDSHFWFGPGFLGGALELFNVVGDVQYAGKLIRSLWNYQDPEAGRFHYSRQQGANAPAEWHTACALIGLRSSGSVAPEPERVNIALEWLRSVQEVDGCWSPGHHNHTTCYVTRQAIEAFTLFEGTGSIAARRGTEWFLKQWCQRGPNPGISYTLMGASALSRTHKDQLYGSISYVFLKEVDELLTVLRRASASEMQTQRDIREELHSKRSELEDLRELSSSLPVENARLQAELASSGKDIDRLANAVTQHELEMRTYALKLTANQLTLWGAILGALGIVLAIFSLLYRRLSPGAHQSVSE